MEMVTLGFTYVKEECKRFWRDNLTVSNCVEVFVMADVFGFQQLRTKALCYICELFNSAGGLEYMPYLQFAELLKCEFLSERWHGLIMMSRISHGMRVHWYS